MSSTRMWQQIQNEVSLYLQRIRIADWHLYSSITMTRQKRRNWQLWFGYWMPMKGSTCVNNSPIQMYLVYHVITAICVLIRWTDDLLDCNTRFCKCVFSLHTKYSIILVELDMDYIFSIFLLVSLQDYNAAFLIWFMYSIHRDEKSLLIMLSLYITNYKLSSSDQLKSEIIAIEAWLIVKKHFLFCSMQRGWWPQLNLMI